MAEHRLSPSAPAAPADDSAVAPPPATLQRFAPGPNAAAEALSHLRRFLDAEACAALPTLAIIVEELALNLAEHGTAREAAIGFARTPAGIRLALTDDGAPFDPRAAAPRDRPPDRGGGAGLALVRAWSRDLAYATAGGINRLDLLVPFEHA